MVGFAVINCVTASISMSALVTASHTMSYHFAVVPLFVMVGNVMGVAGISAELFRIAQVLVGHRKSGLAAVC